MVDQLVEFLRHIKVLEQLHRVKADEVKTEHKQYLLGVARGLALAFETMEICIRPEGEEEPEKILVERRVSPDAIKTREE